MNSNRIQQRDERIYGLLSMFFLTVPECARAFKLTDTQVRRIYKKMQEERKHATK